MSIIHNLKEKRKNKKNANESALRIMLQFAHGEITTREFWEFYKNNESIRNLLAKDKTIPKYAAHLDPGNYVKGEQKIAFTESDLFLYYYPSKLLERFNIDILRDRDALFWIVRTYFTRRNETFEVKNEDAELYKFINIIQPDWLRLEEFDNLLDENFLLNIVDSAPKNLTNEFKVQWCKDKILELFKYERQLPKWLLFPQWPIVNGTPLVFSRQETDANNIDHEYYYFYNPITKNEITVEQFG